MKCTQKRTFSLQNDVFRNIGKISEIILKKKTANEREDWRFE